MRYLLIAVLLVAVVTACHAEDAKTTKTEYAVSVDTTKINLGQQVDGVADALKKHLDGPLGMYYQAAVKRNRVVGGVGSILGIVLLIVTCISWAFAIKHEIFLSEPTVLLFSLVMLGCIASPIIGGFLLSGNCEAFLAPEYVAVRDIMQSIGTIVK